MFMEVETSKSFGHQLSYLNLRWDCVPLWFIDFEGHPRYGVVETGVVCLKNAKVHYTSTRLCAAKSWIPEEETAIHGLEVADVRNYPEFSEDFEFFVSMRRRGVFAAHNRHTEDRLLRHSWLRPPFVPDWSTESGMVAAWGPWLDTLTLMRNLYPGLSAHGLSYLIEVFGLQSQLDALAGRHCPVGRGQYHCALYDALASTLLVLHVARQPGFESMSLGWLLANSCSAVESDAKRQKELFE